MYKIRQVTESGLMRKVKHTCNCCCYLQVSIRLPSALSVERQVIYPENVQIIRAVCTLMEDAVMNVALWNICAEIVQMCRNNKVTVVLFGIIYINCEYSENSTVLGPVS